LGGGVGGGFYFDKTRRLVSAHLFYKEASARPQALWYSFSVGAKHAGAHQVSRNRCLILCGVHKHGKRRAGDPQHRESVSVLDIFDIRQCRYRIHTRMTEGNAALEIPPPK
jgi:hypothetical protein